MRQLATTLHRALWLACLCVCLSSSVVRAADTSIRADLDGDGRSDLITFDGGQPFVLHIWLSSTTTTQTIQSHVPVVRVVAADLDGDHRLEIVARDSGDGLQIWRRGRRGFRSYRPKRIAPGAIGHPNRRQIDDGPTTAPSAVPGQRPGQPSLQAGSYQRAATATSPAWQRPQTRAPDQSTLDWTSAPRPPPPLTT